ncbi:hypothetical protein [Streptomyces rugosispiralis]|uniref:Uncharacterized protein n=1 Tax=Streptomyces rugosispiralis TaxID=2967341 RepID=A0ABT1VA84_9ACTN|nr:hypothetical protein [Streptomyces rugosispiralis]MCQ8194299.1 hypothetical protein [Streptomyces rugosispiralis]
MDHLLGGAPQHSDGRPTIASLAREPGISRATAYRADEILESFRQRVAEGCEFSAQQQRTAAGWAEEVVRRGASDAVDGGVAIGAASS